MLSTSFHCAYLLRAEKSDWSGWPFRGRKSTSDESRFGVNVSKKN